MKTHTFYSDPGHAWLKVNLNALSELGIENKISSYSYMRGSFAYLEEDQDAQVYLDKLYPDGIWTTEVTLKTRHAEKTSIRDFEHYHVRTVFEVEFMNAVKSRLFAMNLKRSALNKVKFASYDDCKFWNNHFNLGYTTKG